MKRTTLIFLLCFTGFTGMQTLAQSANLSHLENEINRLDASFLEILTALEVVRDAELTGIGEFYHNALRTLLQKLPDIGTGIGTTSERSAANAAARIIVQGLGAEQHTQAASDLWQTVLAFDVAHGHNDGFVMHDALTALGQVNDRRYITHIVERLNSLNTQSLIDPETRRRVQRAVVGSINALETFADPRGFRPVFFASMGSFDQSIRNRASIALPNITEDPGDIISEIIRDPSVSPPIKYEAWRELLRTRASSESRARAAAVALDTGWTFMTNNPAHQRDLRSMRVSAIDTIRALGIADGPAADFVYINLERSYRNNFVNPAPDYDEIRRTIACLSALGSEQAVNLLVDFLRELHTRRRAGPWGARERQVFGWVVPGLGATGTQNQDAILLLTTIQRSPYYTGAEQGWATDALRALGQ